MPSIIDNPALAMYVAAAVALVVLAGFFWYLWSLDRGIAELRRRLNDGPAAPQPSTPVVPRRRVSQEHEYGNDGR